MVAVPFAGTFRLIWDDAIFVALGLVCHTGIDHVMVRSMHPTSHAEPVPEVEETVVDVPLIPVQPEVPVEPKQEEI